MKETVGKGFRLAPKIQNASKVPVSSHQSHQLTSLLHQRSGDRVTPSWVGVRGQGSGVRRRPGASPRL